MTCSRQPGLARYPFEHNGRTQSQHLFMGILGEIAANGSPITQPGEVSDARGMLPKESDRLRQLLLQQRVEIVVH